MAKYQVQLHQILDDGTDVFMYPINTALDVQVGKLSTGSLTLPGNASDEILAQTLANIKKYLTNLGTVAEQKRGVSSSTTSTSEIDLATSKAVNDLKVRIDGNDERLAAHTTEIAGKAPINHAVNALTYGGATGTVYGHVILSDVYSTAVANGAAANSVGASQNALYNAFNVLNNAKAPNDHAVNNGTYGLGTGSVYGHVKLSDTYASLVTNGAAVNGVGASQNALYNAYAALKSVNDTQTTNINGKAPTQHASSAAATYGAGTGSAYGHVRLSDLFEVDCSSTGAAANSEGASSWALYRAYSSLASAISTKLAATHASEQATASKFSHVKLSDNYTSSAGAASAGIGASSLAVYNAYAALTSSITSINSTISSLGSKYLALSGGTLTGNLTVTNSTEAKIAVDCANGYELRLQSNASNMGLFDPQQGSYLIKYNYDSDKTTVGANSTYLDIGKSSTYTEFLGSDIFFTNSGGYVWFEGNVEFHKSIEVLDWVNTLWNGTTVHLAGLNSSGNVHMGDYGGNNVSNAYFHAKGMQINFVGYETSDGPGYVRPDDDNKVYLGSGNHRWKQLYAGTATIATSDRNLKRNITSINPKLLQTMLHLPPREFLFKDGDRTHAGIIAQDLEDEMTRLGLSSMDVAALCKDVIYDYDINPEDGTEIESSKRARKDSNGNIMYRYGARYEELISPILKLVQVLWKKVFGSLDILEETESGDFEVIDALKDLITE